LCKELGIPKAGDVSAKSYFFDFDMFVRAWWKE
jgi:hypothetical protein